MNKPLQTLAKLAEAAGVDYSAINSDDMIIQTAEAALKEIKRLTTELSKETVRKEAAYANEQRLKNDNLELRRRIFARFNEDECWIFQDDGHDYPESLVCPVVMSAGKLRELVQARSERDEMAARLERLLIASATVEQALENLNFAIDGLDDLQGALRETPADPLGELRTKLMSSGIRSAMNYASFNVSSDASAKEYKDSLIAYMQTFERPQEAGDA